MESLQADRDLPPFNRSTFDGIALSYGAIEQGQRAFPIVGTGFAGSPKLELTDPKTCVEIMTGAPLPDNADCVVKIEDLDIENGSARIKDGVSLSIGYGVHPQASDSAKGRTLLERGCRLSAKELSVAASIGKAALVVSKQPRISILTTGDELVAVEASPLPHQIRRSNDLALQTALQAAGYTNVSRSHIVDDLEETQHAVTSVLKRADVLILAGGVSKGKRDFLPEALEAAGVDKAFQWISQRPGKPLWFGDCKRDGRRTYVFALPGNPVSCFTCLHRYVLPALDRLCGKRPGEARYAKLASEFQFKPPLTLFLPVLLSSDSSGQSWAEPLPFNTSGDYISVARTQGFIELPKDEINFAKGAPFPFTPWSI